LRWLSAAFILSLPWCADESRAAASIFLRLGNVKGEAQDELHQGEIDVLAFDFGVDSTHTIFGTSTNTINDISLVKYTDVATPELLLLLLSGKPVSDAKLSFVENISGHEQPVVTYQLRDVIVTSHQCGGSGGEDRLIERINLNFAQFTYQTFSYSDAGVLAADPSVTWDITTNTVIGSGGTHNTYPTLTGIANQNTAEDTPHTVAFTVADTETVAGALSMSCSTTNPLVVPLSGIAFGGAGSSRNVTVTPVPNAAGSATLTVTVTDDGGLTASSSFTVTVSPVNDPPLIQAIPSQVTNQGTPLNVAVVVSDIDSSATAVTLSPASDNPALIPAANITFSGSGATTQMTLTPVPGASGSAQITLTANDGSANSAPVSFTLTVNVVNQGPTDIHLLGPGSAAPVVNENSPSNTLIGSLSVSDPDDGNQATYQLMDAAGGRFKLAGTSLNQVAVADGTLIDFEAAATHRITVRATDSALHTFDKIFTITVINVNEAPVITTAPCPAFAAGGSAPVSGLSLADPDSGAADISLNMLVSQGTLHLDDSASLTGKVSGNGTRVIHVTAPVAGIAAVLQAGGLVYSAVGVAAGIHTLAIEASDLGNTGTGGAAVANATLELVVQASPFNQWRERWFSAAQLADPLVSGPLGDPDHDGVANLLEYGVGANPNDPQDGPGLVEFIQQEFEGTDYPALRFKRLKASLDPALLISVEIATDAFKWRTEPGDVVVVSSLPFDEARDQVIIRSALPLASASRQLLRLRFSLRPA
jgi:type VI protein secretion system component Hcp